LRTLVIIDWIEVRRDRVNWLRGAPGKKNAQVSRQRANGIDRIVKLESMPTDKAAPRHGRRYTVLVSTKRHAGTLRAFEVPSIIC
jgi:hypothetical protein